MTTGWRSRATPTTVGLGLVVTGLAIVGVGGFVLAWDGSWFVLRTAETGTPTFMHGRVAGWVIQAPIVVVRSLSDDPTVLTVVAGLSFASVPALSVLACWRVTRPDRDDLLALAVLGIGLVGLAGVAVLISEAMMAVALGWPLVLAAALGRLGRHRLLAATIALLLAGIHPFAVPILSLVVVAILVRSVAHPTERPAAIRAIALVVILMTVLVVRYLTLGSSYETATLDLDRLGAHWRGAVAGRPLVAIGVAWALGLLVILRPRLDRVGIVLVAAGILLVAAAMVVWAADVDRWQRALMYRTWILALSMPLIGLAILAGRRARADVRPEVASLVIPAVGVAMILVLTVQTLAWGSTIDAFRAELAMRTPGCVEASDLDVDSTPLAHWGVTSLGLMVEGPRPPHLVAVGVACASIDAVGGVPIKILDGVIVERVAPDGWLDLEPLARVLGGSP